MHNAVVSKLIAASRGSPCDSMASCFQLLPVSKVVVVVVVVAAAVYGAIKTENQ